MSISELVPIKQAEEAILDELDRAGRPIKTSELVTRTIKRFPQLTRAELRRTTPCGSNWWRGRIRFDLDRLKKRGEVVNVSPAYWAISRPTRRVISSNAFVTA